MYNVSSPDKTEVCHECKDKNDFHSDLHSLPNATIDNAISAMNDRSKPFLNSCLSKE